MRASTGKPTISIGLLAMLALAIVGPAVGDNANKSVKIGADSETDGSSSVNGSITVGSGARVNGDLDTVNGRIRIEANARVLDVATVNGSVDIGAGVTTGDVETVNGAIRVAEDVSVDGRLEAVNGGIKVAKGSMIKQNLGNINGEIELNGSRVEGDVTTVSGDIELRNAAEVIGDIRIEEPRGWSLDNWRRRPPRVVIGPGARVHGTIVAEHEIELYISESAEVGGVSGELSMADAVRFSGERP